MVHQKIRKFIINANRSAQMVVLCTPSLLSPPRTHTDTHARARTDTHTHMHAHILLVAIDAQHVLFAGTSHVSWPSTTHQRDTGTTHYTPCFFQTIAIVHSSCMASKRIASNMSPGWCCPPKGLQATKKPNNQFPNGGYNTDPSLQQTEIDIRNLC